MNFKCQPCYATYNLPTLPLKQTMVSISLIVPLIPRDFESCIEMIHSLNANTVLPKEMIIGLSGGSIENTKKFEDRVRKTLDPRISFHLSYTPQKCNCAKNRNRASRLSSQSILTYFDGDDLMHKRRFEIIWDVFSNYDVDVFYHGFCKKHREDVYPHPMIMKNKDLILRQTKSGWPSIPRSKKTHGICAGNVSMRKEIFRRHHFNESQKLSRSEDSDWADKALHSDLKVLYIHLPLTFYRPSNS